MAQPQSVIRVHESVPTLFVRVEGWGTMVQSLPLRRFVESALARGICQLQLDLGPCQYLDSTFLGTLFLLKRTLNRRCGGDIILSGLSPPCTELLRQMGVDNLFGVAQSPDLSREQWQELQGAGAEALALQHNVVQAHQELASMEGKVGDTFRPVAHCLARELDTQPEI